MLKNRIFPTYAESSTHLVYVKKDSYLFKMLLSAKTVGKGTFQSFNYTKKFCKQHID